MLCFHRVLITIFMLSAHIFQKELDADVKTARWTPLIQNQGFPPATILLQHLPKSTLFPKLHTEGQAMWKRAKGDEGEQELYQSCAVISELSIKQGREKHRSQDFFLQFGPSTVRCNKQTLVEWKHTATERQILSVRCSKCPPTLFPNPRKNPAPSSAPREGGALQALVGRGERGEQMRQTHCRWLIHRGAIYWNPCGKTKFFACSDMIQAHQSKPKVHWIKLWSFPHLVSFSGGAGIQVSVTLSTNEFTRWEDSSQPSAFLMLPSISCIIHPKSAATSRAVKGEVCDGLGAPDTASRESSASWSSQREQFGESPQELSFSSSLPFWPPSRGIQQQRAPGFCQWWCWNKLRLFSSKE